MKLDREEVVNLINKSFKEGRRFPEEESILKGDPKHIYSYVINSKMKPEEIPNWMLVFISTSSSLSLLLEAKLSTNNEEIVEAISKKAITSFMYSTRVLKNRFDKGETLIMGSVKYRNLYLTFLKTLRGDE
jgi:hypothetical protein